MAERTLEQLEQEELKVVQGEFVDDEDDDDTMFNDLDAANDLLKRAAILLDFMSDPVMCRNISKRERDIMARFSDEIHDFTKEVDEYYLE